MYTHYSVENTIFTDIELIKFEFQNLFRSLHTCTCIPIVAFFFKKKAKCVQIQEQVDLHVLGPCLT